MNEMMDRLQDEFSRLQCEYDKLKQKEYNNSYQIENQKKRITDLADTLKLYEDENRALRKLVKLWA